MSAETITSGQPSAAPQGGNPVPKLETRGERDFASQLETQSAPKKETPEVTNTPPAEGQAQTPAATTTPPTTPPAAATPTNADTIKSIVEATVAGLQKGVASSTPAAEPPISDADFFQRYGIPQVDERVMQAILDADPKKGAQAMQSLIIAAVRSGALIAKDVTGLDIQKMRGEFEPDVKEWRTYRQKQAAEAAVKSFYAENKDLVGEEALVDEMADAINARMNAGQLKFSSQKEKTQAVADAARKILVRIRPPGAAAVPGGGTSTPPATRQMSGASSPGRSGTGQPQQKSVVDEIFGADAR